MDSAGIPCEAPIIRPALCSIAYGSDAPDLPTKPQHNSLTRIHAIPSEILAKMFIQLYRCTSLDSILERPFFATSELGILHDRSQIGNELSSEASDVDWSWTSVMLVCRHFRAVMLDCHQLWSIIDFMPRGKTPWTILCMNRVKSYPPTIRGRVPGNVDTDSLQFRKDIQLYTTSQALSIQVPKYTGDSQRALNLLFNRPYPALHSLQLSVNPRVWWDKGSTISIHMDSAFLGGVATNLISLHLNLHSHLRLLVKGAPCFPSLLLLKLNKVTLDISDLHTLLSKTPKLHSLIIYQLSLDSRTSRPLINTGKRVLQPLQQLRSLQWTGSVCLATLSQIIPQSFTHLHIRIDDPSCLEGGNDVLIPRIICNLVSSYVSTALGEGSGVEIESNFSSLLIENRRIDDGWSEIAVQVMPVWGINTRLPSIGLTVRIPCPWSYMRELLDTIAHPSLDLGPNGTLSAHEETIIQCDKLWLLRIALMGTHWIDTETDINIIARILPLRVARGHKLKHLDIRFYDVKEPQEELEVVAQMKNLCNAWIKAGWVDRVLFYVPDIGITDTFDIGTIGMGLTV